MEDLFRSYWWLLFPFGWFVAMGFQSLINYRRHRDTLDLLKRYADSGKEPPAELLRAINRQEDLEAEVWGADSESRRHRRDSSWPWPANVVLFLGLGAAFWYASYEDFYGAGEAFTIASIVMAVLAVSFAVSGIFSRRNRP